MTYTLYAHHTASFTLAPQCSAIAYVSMCPINFRWEETYTPIILPRSRSPHNAASYYTCTIRKWVRCVSAVTRQPLSLRAGAHDNLRRGHVTSWARARARHAHGAGRGRGRHGPHGMAYAWHAVKHIARSRCLVLLTIMSK